MLRTAAMTWARRESSSVRRRIGRRDRVIHRCEQHEVGDRQRIRSVNDVRKHAMRRV